MASQGGSEASKWHWVAMGSGLGLTQPPRAAQRASD